MELQRARRSSRQLDVYFFCLIFLNRVQIGSLRGRFDLLFWNQLFSPAFSPGIQSFSLRTLAFFSLPRSVEEEDVPLPRGPRTARPSLRARERDGRTRMGGPCGARGVVTLVAVAFVSLVKLADQKGPLRDQIRRHLENLSHGVCKFTFPVPNRRCERTSQNRPRSDVRHLQT